MEPSAPCVNILDLFSGVGGFSYALHAIGRTVAYCEANADCRTVLRTNMQAGRLDTAPIFEDVTTLSGSSLSCLTSQTQGQTQPELITAGFPCQDISIAGGQCGLDGARSSLFFHIPRLVRELPSVKHVLLENSPNIKNKGMDRVLEELRAAGLCHIAYGFFTARDVGALHRRARWVCLASRDPVSLQRLCPSNDINSVQAQHDWASDAVPRVVLRPAQGALRKRMVQRCSMMGNSVVPQFIAHVYDALARTLIDAAATNGGHSSSHSNQQLLRPSAKGTRGIIHLLRPDACISSPALLPYAALPHTPITVQLVADDGSVLATLPHWYTPLHSTYSWAQGRKVYRGSRTLENQANAIYYASDTQCPGVDVPSRRSMTYTINPGFIEHMMGYPQGWTDSPVQTQTNTLTDT